MAHHLMVCRLMWKLRSLSKAFFICGLSKLKYVHGNQFRGGDSSASYKSSFGLTFEFLWVFGLAPLGLFGEEDSEKHCRSFSSHFLAWLKWKGLLHFLEKLRFNHWNAPYRTLTTSKMSKNILKHVDPPSYQNNILEILVAFSQAFKIESFAKISRFAPKI